MSEPIDLDAIRARVEAATAGPWKLAYWYHTKSAHGLGRYVERPKFAGYESFTDADEALIADAPTDIPALLAEVERLRTALAALRDAVDDWTLNDVPLAFFRAHRAVHAAREALGTTGNEGA